MSYQYKREDGVTVEVQRLKEAEEYHGRGSEAKAFVSGVVVGGSVGVELLLGQGPEVGLAREGAA